MAQTDLKNCQIISFDGNARNEKLFMMNTLIDDAINKKFHYTYFEEVSEMDSIRFFEKVPTYFDSLMIDTSWRYSEKMKFHYSSKIGELNLGDVLITKRKNRYTGEEEFVGLKVKFEFNNKSGIVNFEFLDKDSEMSLQIEEVISNSISNERKAEEFSANLLPPAPPPFPQMNKKLKEERMLYTIRSSFDWYALRNYSKIHSLSILCLNCIEIPVDDFDELEIKSLTIEAVRLKLDKSSFLKFEGLKRLYVERSSGDLNEALKGATELETLILNFRDRREVPSAIFDLKNLISLTLWKVSEELIVDSTLVSKSVKKLYLKGTDFVPLKMFENLEFISLDILNDSSYPFSREFPPIEKISFFNLNFEEVPDWIYNLNNLEEISIRQVKNDFPSGFEKIKSLKKISLSSGISLVPSEILKQLEQKDNLIIN